jgi:hypothetical protein
VYESNTVSFNKLALSASNLSLTIEQQIVFFV